MGLLFRKKSPDEEPQMPVGDHPGVRTVAYSGGHAAGAKALIVGFYAVVALSLLMSFTAMTRPAETAAASVQQAQQPLSLTEQGAGAFAAGYVGTWLSATTDNYAGLQQYVGLSSGSDLQAQPMAYRDLQIASIAPNQGNLISVVISAGIREVNDKKQESWPVRYFQVTVANDAGSLGVVGMPAPISAPARTDKGAQLIYRELVSPSDPAAQTISSFLSAYATGQGEMGRYITPGSTLRPITPAPFSAVKIVSVTADVPPAKQPADGDKIKALVQAQLSGAAGQKLMVTYALALTARAGRWETTSVDTTPTPATDSTPPTLTTPTPSKGK